MSRWRLLNGVSFIILDLWFFLCAEEWDVGFKLIRPLVPRLGGSVVSNAVSYLSEQRAGSGSGFEQAKKKKKHVCYPYEFFSRRCDWIIHERRTEQQQLVFTVGGLLDSVQ